MAASAARGARLTQTFPRDTVQFWGGYIQPQAYPPLWRLPTTARPGIRQRRVGGEDGEQTTAIGNGIAGSNPACQILGDDTFKVLLPGQRDLDGIARFRTSEDADFQIDETRRSAEDLCMRWGCVRCGLSCHG